LPVFLWNRKSSVWPGNSAVTESFRRFHQRYRRIVETGYAQNPVAQSSAGPKRRGRRKQSKARNLLDRFRDHPNGILAFMHDFAVPFDNNLEDRLPY
jgi:transposase